MHLLGIENERAKGVAIFGAAQGSTFSKNEADGEGLLYLLREIGFVELVRERLIGWVEKLEHCFGVVLCLGYAYADE